MCFAVGLFDRWRLGYKRTDVVAAPVKVAYHRGAYILQLRKGIEQYGLYSRDAPVGISQISLIFVVGHCAYAT